MEAFSLASLGGLALSQGIKFLYDQAGEILRRRRERKDKGDAEASAPVPVPTPSVLAGDLKPISVDFQAADELAEELKALRAQLNEIAQGNEDVDPSDERIIRATDALRDAVESIIGQRITFEGEAREPSGTPVVTGTVKAKDVRGKATGAEVGEIFEGKVTGKAEAETIHEGADVAGVRAGNIGNKGS